MGVVIKPLVFAGVSGKPDQNFFPEGFFGALGNADLLFNGAHQLFIRVQFFVRNGVLQLDAVAVSLHVIQVVVEQYLGGLFIGVDKGLLDLLFGHFIIFLAGHRDEIEQAVPLLLGNGGMLVQAFLQRPQNVQGVDAPG